MSSDELQLIALDATPRIVEEQAIVVDDDVLARIDAVWATAPDGSFDGQIFNVHALETTEIRGAFTPYRYYFASRRDSDIAAELGLLPLGVSGVVQSADGVLFGRRARGVTDFAGAWELAPSGGVAPECRRAGEVSLETQLLDELAEETPFDARDVTRLTPLVLAVDVDIVDVCFCIDIRSSKPLAPTDEYAELRWVVDVAEFVAQHGVIDLSQRLAEVVLASRAMT